MSYVEAQLATETFPLMEPQWEAVTEGCVHFLPGSYIQGVDVIPVAHDYAVVEAFSGNLQCNFEIRVVNQCVSTFFDRVTDAIIETSTVGIGIERVHEYVYENLVIDQVSARNLIDYITTRNLADLSLLTFFPRSFEYSQPHISTLQERFEFKYRDEVTRFLEKNAFLIDLLIESEGKIKAEFGDLARFVLQVVKDPDFDDNEELFLIIKTTLSDSEASEALERLDNNWWIEASSRARCQLNIDYELA